MADRPHPLTNAEDSQDARDRTEERLDSLFARALQAFLAQVRREVTARLDDPQVLLAASGRDPLTLGQMAGWWAAVVDRRMIRAVTRAYRAAYGRSMSESALRSAVEDYLPRVRDRLVRGITPPVYDDSFDKVRLILARSAGAGLSRPETAELIALELSWETSGPRWRRQLSKIDSRIDKILDPLGPPGTPAREAARLSDPAVRALQAQRSDVILRLDAEKSYWETRANRIARTESTALHGFGADGVLAAEGWTHKKWVATLDKRTRDSHAAADGQVVPVDGQFSVGLSALQFPGDPSGPAEEVINCRCTIIGSDPPGL